MNSEHLARQLAQRGAALAATLIDRLAAAVITIAEVDLPGVAVTRRDDGVVLQAPGLRARALGTRRTPPDPRLSALLIAARSQRGRR